MTLRNVILVALVMVGPIGSARAAERPLPDPAATLARVPAAYADGTGLHRPRRIHHRRFGRHHVYRVEVVRRPWWRGEPRWTYCHDPLVWNCPAYAPPGDAVPVAALHAERLTSYRDMPAPGYRHVVRHRWNHAARHGVRHAARHRWGGHRTGYRRAVPRTYFGSQG